MSTLFISDLHLSAHHPSRIQLAVDFLQAECGNIKTLYILGDLFDTWIGDDVIQAEFEPLIKQLRNLNLTGVKSYFMVGNRDFMVGKRFTQRAGCQMLSDSYVINLYGTPTLLLHGDTLCIDDIAYQRYRSFSRNLFLQWCFLRLPRHYRQAISNKIKQQSHQQKSHKSAMIMDVNQTEVEHIMAKFKVTQLIHGHTHRPAIHALKISGKPARRIVLGDWGDKISYLKVTADRRYQLNDPRITLSTGFI